jgi:endo-1,4-beta-xylanase
MKNNQLFNKECMTLTQGIMRGVLSLSAVTMLLFTSCSKEELETQSPTDQNNSSINKASASRLGDKFYANLTSSSTGMTTDNGFFWTIDKDGPMGTAYLSFDGAGVKTPTNNLFPGNFLMSWSGVKQVVGGKGWPAGSNKVINYNIGGLTGTVKFVGVYGWTKDPLTEYYVAEKGPGALYTKVKVGTGTNTASYTSDGNTYSLTKSQRVNAPSIEGTQTFWQFESLRNNQVGIGVNQAINMTTHFTKWKELLNPANNPAAKIFGTTLNGTRCYMVFGCEAYDYSTATANVTGSLNATIW